MIGGSSAPAASPGSSSSATASWTGPRATRDQLPALGASRQAARAPARCGARYVRHSRSPSGEVAGAGVGVVGVGEDVHERRAVAGHRAVERGTELGGCRDELAVAAEVLRDPVIAGAGREIAQDVVVVELAHRVLLEP